MGHWVVWLGHRVFSLVPLLVTEKTRAHHSGTAARVEVEPYNHEMNRADCGRIGGFNGRRIGFKPC